MSDSYRIYDYVRVALLRQLTSQGWPDGFHRLQAFRDQFRDKYFSVVSNFNTGIHADAISIMIDNLFDEIIEGDVFATRDGGIAGTYYRFVPQKFEKFQNDILAKDPIFDTAQAIGPDRYFADVFEVINNSPHIDGAFSTEFSMRDFDTGPNIVIPASDRLVTLGHNQQHELDESATALISAVEKENSINGDAETRSWMLGRLKASRELVRAGSLHVWLMQATILNVLQSLISNYKDHAIGAAASVLLELLIKHIFGISA